MYIVRTKKNLTIIKKKITNKTKICLKPNEYRIGANMWCDLKRIFNIHMVGRPHKLYQVIQSFHNHSFNWLTLKVVLLCHVFTPRCVFIIIMPTQRLYILQKSVNFRFKPFTKKYVVFKLGHPKFLLC